MGVGGDKNVLVESKKPIKQTGAAEPAKPKERWEIAREENEQHRKIALEEWLLTKPLPTVIVCR